LYTTNLMLISVKQGSFYGILFQGYIARVLCAIEDKYSMSLYVLLKRCVCVCMCECVCACLYGVVCALKVCVCVCEYVRVNLGKWYTRIKCISALTSDQPVALSSKTMM
jgi:hypothetical protein